MSNSLHYVATNVAPYLVAAARCLRLVSLDSEELASIRSKPDELSSKFVGIKEEKRKFQERYDLLDGEKKSVEE